MPRKTLTQRAEEYGVTRDILNNAKNQGVNVWNDQEFGDWVRSRRPKSDSTSQAGSGGFPSGSIPEIKESLRQAQAINDIKALKEKLEAMLKVQKLEQESGKLIPIGEVEERDIRIGSAVRAGVLKLCSDAAPMVEGLTAAKAQAVLMEQGKLILEQLADSTSEFWKQHERRIQKSNQAPN